MVTSPIPRSPSSTQVTILSIGFEGPNRVGKGTQCTLVQKWLAQCGIPSLIIRGDGSRPGQGQRPGDPWSSWWQAMSLWLHSPQASYADWNVAACRLARELVVWRGRVLPDLARAHNRRLAVLLVDRSLLSRTMILRAMQAENCNNLYPVAPGRGRPGIDPNSVCPDLILNLTVPKHEVLSRLDPNDPKYEFRKRLIHQTHDWFQDAADFLPRHLRARVVQIDASKTRDTVFSEILHTLISHFDVLGNLG